MKALFFWCECLRTGCHKSGNRVKDVASQCNIAGEGWVFLPIGNHDQTVIFNANFGIC